MPFSGIADSEQLKILTAALDSYCQANGIDPTSPERGDIGQIIIALFNNGARSPEDLKAALERALGR